MSAEFEDAEDTKVGEHHGKPRGAYTLELLKSWAQRGGGIAKSIWGGVCRIARADSPEMRAAKADRVRAETERFRQETYQAQQDYETNTLEDTSALRREVHAVLTSGDLSDEAKLVELHLLSEQSPKLKAMIVDLADYLEAQRLTTGMTLKALEMRDKDSIEEQGARIREEDDQLRLWKDKGGRFRWVLLTGDGIEVARAKAGYGTRERCLQNAEFAGWHGRSDSIIDETTD
ncbi:MAG: hypothetical protein AAFU73_20125 [Planctomycetota bacterium]